MTTRLLTLIIKEFKAIWKDPRSRMIVTIMPIIQLIVFAKAVYCNRSVHLSPFLCPYTLK